MSKKSERPPAQTVLPRNLEDSTPLRVREALQALNPTNCNSKPEHLDTNPKPSLILKLKTNILPSNLVGLEGLVCRVYKVWAEQRGFRGIFWLFLAAGVEGLGFRV